MNDKTGLIDKGTTDCQTQYWQVYYEACGPPKQRFAVEAFLY